jgi:carboxymethylenebutenolidase
MNTRLARALLLALTATLLPAAASAQDWAKAALAKSPRHGEFVTIPAPGGRSLQAWVVYPEVKDKAPVVVLIHEIFGESDWFRLMADDLAAAGYIAIAPDLLSGYGPATTAAAPMPANMDHMHMDTPAPGSPTSTPLPTTARSSPPRPTNSTSPASAGVAASPSSTPPTAKTSARPSSSTARRPRPS